MRLEKTTILSSISPVQIKNKPSLITYEFVASLIANQEITQYIKLIRKTYNQPENGININQFLGFDLLDDEKSKELFDSILLVFPEYLLTTYGLSKDYVLNIALLIFFNAVIDLEDYEVFTKQDIEFIATKKALSNRLWELPYEACGIILPYAKSIAELHRFIDDNSEEIKQKMNNTLFKNTFIQKIHDLTELSSEIITLRDNEGKKFNEISNELFDKNPDKPELSDETYIRKIYERYKIYWQLRNVQDNNLLN